MGCAKSENANIVEESMPQQTELTVGGGGSGSDCFNTPCPCTGEKCKGFSCCTVRTAGTEDTRQTCRKSGNQPLPHYVYVGIDGFNQNETNHSHFTLQRTLDSNTVILVFNSPNAIEPGESELTWLDDGLSSSWQFDTVIYDLFLYDSTNTLISKYSVSGIVN